MPRKEHHTYVHIIPVLYLTYIKLPGFLENIVHFGKERLQPSIHISGHQTVVEAQKRCKHTALRPWNGLTSSSHSQEKQQMDDRMMDDRMMDGWMDKGLN